MKNMKNILGLVVGIVSISALLGCNLGTDVVPEASSTDTTSDTISEASRSIITISTEPTAVWGNGEIQPLNITLEYDDTYYTVSYQWYSADDVVDAGTAITDATDAAYTPDTTVEGTKYYFCIVIGTHTVSDTVSITVNVKSAVIGITVGEATVLVNAATPDITFTSGITYYEIDETVEPIVLTATITDAGILSYQWYSTADLTTGGSAISGATNNSYTPSSASIGTLYYFCVVTNTNSSVNGDTTTQAISGTKTIIVDGGSSSATAGITVTF